MLIRAVRDFGSAPSIQIEGRCTGLRALDPIRTRFRNLDGSWLSDNAARYLCYHLRRADAGARLAQPRARIRYARDDVRREPVKLMRWTGHKRVDETMLYVNFAEAHMRPLPEGILRVGRGHDDPDQRIIAMLSARKSRC